MNKNSMNKSLKLIAYFDKMIKNMQHSKIKERGCNILKKLEVKKVNLLKRIKLQLNLFICNVYLFICYLY